jgi:hypothetical protein
MKKKRKKQLLKIAKKNASDIQMRLGWCQPKEKICTVYKMTMAEYRWLLNNSKTFARAVEMGNNRAYAVDMSRLEKLMTKTDVSPSLIKLYMAERHGITDKPSDDGGADNAIQMAQLFKEIAEKLPK